MAWFVLACDLLAARTVARIARRRGAFAAAVYNAVTAAKAYMSKHGSARLREPSARYTPDKAKRYGDDQGCRTKAMVRCRGWCRSRCF